MNSLDSWKFLAGLGLFLYGMSLMEHVVKKLAGRSFKLLLRRYSQRLFKAIASGAVVTVLLQSSSLVSLLVLAFVGAGVVGMREALGIILGSNLGTTLYNWIVVALGFKLDIESYTLPVIAVATLGMTLFVNRKKVYNSFRLLLATGLLFFGLGYMKSGSEALVTTVDLSPYVHFGSLVFVGAGMLITAIIQASSATVAIALTALNAQAIPFEAAAALVIGSEVGTSVKLIFAGVTGSADKKRVAWGNFYFNVVTAAIAVLGLPLLIRLVRQTLHVTDPLFALVIFQTLINLLAILLFVPFIGWFARWLEKRFTPAPNGDLPTVPHDLTIAPELAVDTLHQEARKLVAQTAAFHEKVLDLDEMHNEKGWLHTLKAFAQVSGSTEEEYSRLKQAAGDLLEYHTHLQTADLETEEHQRMNQDIRAIRQAGHAAKSIKDIHHNLKEFQDSANDVLHDHYHQLQQDWAKFAGAFRPLLALANKAELIQKLSALMADAFRVQQENNESIAKSLKNHQLGEMEASTLINVQREVLSAKKALLRAVAHLHLTETEAEEFEYLPG
ncbi:MAG: Na/Pi symporter [Cytophagales bacterium]|nr:Na/Pi symporter [Cytophagales bacterium]